MFDPNEHVKKCELYLSRFLGYPVGLIRAKMLVQSSRQAPWRLDVMANGVERTYVLQLDQRGMEHEYRILKALESIAIPTPRVYGLDLQGEALGVSCFFSDFIEGESLLRPMLAGETWAEALYLDSVFSLQAVTRADLGEAVSGLGEETAEEVLENTYAYFKDKPHPLAEAMYKKLKATLPQFPPVRFSNGDLWLENFITRDQKLAGVIDFQHAGFSDPLFEFLLSFFVSPELQGRGIEERYCDRIGVDSIILHWYHGLEFFDAWRWTFISGKSFVHHTADSLQTDIENWFGECIPTCCTYELNPREE
jgi:aminoglycoside phosphotransferase (APT) family kinase protein